MIKPAGVPHLTDQSNLTLQFLHLHIIVIIIINVIIIIIITIIIIIILYYWCGHNAQNGSAACDNDK